ncbi:MAG TPA: D-aminoacylase [Vicinamibacterales bacterium]|jgi:N-acyl-D-amino-acid deacylase|nr:D-aminoacylase [Vicinamibacterales bacterium]
MTGPARFVAAALVVVAITVHGARRVGTAGRAIVISNAEIADGSGSPLRRATVRIEDGRIAAVGERGNSQPGDLVIDGAGQMLAPGFIDIHNHSTTELTADPRAETQVAQGLTTIVVGADGSSPWPIADYLAERQQHPSALNVMVMVGHATVRRLVMGDDYKRPATDAEIAKMAALVDRGMREGAIGLSSGLEYEVGSYSETKELVELAKAAARYGGFYMSHIRDEADRSFDAQREAIAIGEQARLPVQISHIKLGTVSVWHKAATTIALVEAARRRGLDITADCYPYDAWHSTLTVLVPNKQYEDPASVAKALADVGGAGNVTIDRMKSHPEYEFKTLERIAKDKGITPVALFIQIVREGGASVIGRTMVDDDIRAFYEQPWVMVASDGGINLRHPRSAGTFPRVLGRYVREQHWLTLPEAVRKMTSAPATRLKLGDRGKIAVGAIADLVLFDPKTVSDRSTFADPAALAVGISRVFVSGVEVWAGAKPTGELPGHAIARR